ncbi:TOMM precursor leader peptide-binding protein, partial [Streptomyces sp. NPDC057543]|uniref:TOMM precursor leader peptide-binding protein n=1 Tax=Streptomyces sp. NPDC057543 TaxID=3346163 RepID=UPI0036A284C9
MRSLRASLPAGRSLWASLPAGRSLRASPPASRSLQRPDPVVHLVDLQTLGVRRYPLLPDPECPACGRTEPDTAQAATLTPSTSSPTRKLS